MTRDLRIHTCDHLPVLADRLATTMAQAPLPPLQSETVVVQSLGLAQWLRMHLAGRLGIAASIHTPFPATFAQRLAERVLDGGARATVDPFARDTLRWRVHRLLLDNLEHSTFAPLRTYLDHDPDQRKGLQLAGRIAERFEEYSLYRPELLRGWVDGPAQGASGMLPFAAGKAAANPHGKWQRFLWRTLCAEVDGRPLAESLEQLIDALRSRDDIPVPPRVAVFGVSHLPPALLDVLWSLAERCPVDLYLLLPPGERAAKLHPLVDRFGRQGLDLWALLQERDPDGNYFEDVFGELPDGDAPSLLALLQQDLRDLVDRGAGDAPPVDLDPTDRSLTVHACHNPRREVEVLRDQVLAAFDELPDLQPSDVLILVPDVATYAPHLLAVFARPLDDGSDRAGGRALPLDIADRADAGEAQVMAAFLQLLRTLRSRMERDDLRSLLDCGPVRTALGLSLQDATTVSDWLRTAEIRWGLDGEWRHSHFDVPPEEAHSLRRGIDRLLLGVCTGPVAEPVAGLLPSADATTGRAEVLGAFAEAVQRLSDADRATRGGRTLRDWGAILLRLVDQFVGATDESDHVGLRLLRQRITELAAQSDAADNHVPLGLAAVVDLFEELVDSAAPHGRGMATGAIVACSLRPMRSLPFRVIAIAGLDDGAFPRSDRRVPFDLLQDERQRGDRSARDDDRQLFLETLMAAQERLIMTYVGFSPRDGSPRPPSLCVSELLDHAARSMVAAEGVAALTTVHPLHGFDPRYGRDPGLFTYAAAEVIPSVSFLAQPSLDGPSRAANGGPLPDTPVPPADLEPIDLSDLVEFWRHPQKAFARRVLGVSVPSAEDADPLTEPFNPTGLEAYLLRSEALAQELRDGLRQEPWWRAGDRLPHGGTGTMVRNQVVDDVAPLMQAVASRKLADQPVDLPIQLADAAADDGPAGRIVGVIPHVDRTGHVHLRPGRVTSKDELGAWIHHLALSLHRERHDELPPTSTVVGIDKDVTLAAMLRPAPVLAALVRGYLWGQDGPLPFFPEPSQKAANRLRKGGHATAVFRAADAEWSGDRGRGPGSDAWVRYTFRDGPPLDEAFLKWADAVWGSYTGSPS